MNNNTALVLFSGGQDSTTCLAWALDNFAHVETIGFNYGQRHLAEMGARPVVRAAIAGIEKWSGKLGEDHILPINTMSAIGGTALTNDMKIEMGRDGLPNTFVPGRNIFFLTAAAALGYRRGISDLVGGMCETDFSGYPDCRDDTIKATAQSLSLGLAREVRIHTPLMFIDKAATWKMAEDIGGRMLVDLIIRETVTCYNGVATPRDWGKGCGACPACDLRAKGYAAYRAA